VCLLKGARYALWDATGWHRDNSPPAWRNRATAEQKRLGWAMVVCIEKILCTVLHETHERQVEGTMVAHSEGSETSRRAIWIVPRGDHRLL
jgi:hypothetical protein